jgi:hypothetical protein
VHDRVRRYKALELSAVVTDHDIARQILDAHVRRIVELILAA